MDGSANSSNSGLANNLIPPTLLLFDFKCGKCSKEINLHSTEQQAKTYRMTQFVLCKCTSCNAWNNLHYIVQNYPISGVNPYSFQAKDGHTITVYHCYGSPKKDIYTSYSSSSSYASTSPQSHAINEPVQYSYQSQHPTESQLPPFPIFHNNYNYYNYYQQNTSSTNTNTNYNSNSSSTYNGNNQQINQFSNDELILRVEKENTIGQLKLKARDYGIKPSGKNKHDLATAIVYAETSTTNPALIMSQMANSPAPNNTNNNGVTAPSTTSNYGISNGYYNYNSSSYPQQNPPYSATNYNTQNGDNSPPYVPPSQANSMKRTNLAMENGNPSYENNSTPKKPRTSPEELNSIANLVPNQNTPANIENEHALPLSGQIS